MYKNVIHIHGSTDRRCASSALIPLLCRLSTSHSTPQESGAKSLSGAAWGKDGKDTDHFGGFGILWVGIFHECSTFFSEGSYPSYYTFMRFQSCILDGF